MVRYRTQTYKETARFRVDLAEQETPPDECPICKSRGQWAVRARLNVDSNEIVDWTVYCNACGHNFEKGSRQQHLGKATIGAL